MAEMVVVAASNYFQYTVLLTFVVSFYLLNRFCACAFVIYTLAYGFLHVCVFFWFGCVLFHMLFPTSIYLLMFSLFTLNLLPVLVLRRLTMVCLPFVGLSVTFGIIGHSAAHSSHCPGTGISLG